MNDLYINTQGVIPGKKSRSKIYYEYIYICIYINIYIRIVLKYLIQFYMEIMSLGVSCNGRIVCEIACV